MDGRRGESRHGDQIGRDFFSLRKFLTITCTEVGAWSSRIVSASERPD
jgi:hypothetical protein